MNLVVREHAIVIVVSAVSVVGVEDGVETFGTTQWAVVHWSIQALYSVDVISLCEATITTD
jgi:hypothetical protein